MGMSNIKTDLVDALSTIADVSVSYDYSTAAESEKAIVIESLDLSYQHDLGRNADFLEVDLGYELITNLVNIACSYDFMLAQPQWTAKGEWGVYVGPAVKAGFAGVGCYLAAGAQVGLEYTFEFPLQLSLDFRPVLGAAIVGGSASIYGGGPATFCPGLSVRYRF